MGICWCSPADNLTPRTADHFSSVVSHTTSNSRFSASRGDEAFPNGQIILPTPNLRIFNLAELKSATKNFRPDLVLGEGAFGKVYKGWLDEKSAGKSGSGTTLIAVKRKNSKSVQGIEEWQSEINFLGRWSHPHLVRLLGYCRKDEEFLLVYEYMKKGSLENHLFGKSSVDQPLDWNIRLRIAIGAAKGLCFLHTDEQVIHRDIKPSNILLDGSYTAKISGFGLAKLGPSASQLHVSTRVMGTYGYAAPEYVATGHLYIKSDVYSFGVVLVEILTGLRAVDRSRPSGQLILVDWAKPYLSERRKLNNIMDHRLKSKYPSNAAFQIAQLALKCLAPEPMNRPSMTEVVETLVQIESSNEKPTAPEKSFCSSSDSQAGLADIAPLMSTSSRE